MIRTFEASPGSRFAEVERIEVEYARIEGIVRSPAGIRGHHVLDAEARRIVLPNADGDVFVAQLQVPVGELEQLRLFPSAVTLHARNGETFVLGPDGPELPSWSRTGWKIVPDEGTPFVILQDELTGVRGLLDFRDRIVRNGPRTEPAHRWKLKPTLPAEEFAPNPGPDEGGVFANELNVVFQAGVSRARIDDLNAEIGAELLHEPVLSTWWRVRIPVTQTLQTATDHYHSHPDEVISALPAVNFALRDHALPSEGVQGNQELANFPEAWHEASVRGADLVGSHQVRVAVIESGSFCVSSPTLRRNIWINQGELPLGLFDADDDEEISADEIALWDCDPPGDGDGLITIRDLECAPPGTIQPEDSNLDSLGSFRPNGVIDVEDILNDSRWADGRDNDENCIVDDLAGAAFRVGQRPSNRIAGLGTFCTHSGYVASIVGAEGNLADMGMAGANWRVSIVPIVVSGAAGGAEAPPDTVFTEALRYVMGQGFEIANFSAGTTFLRKGTNRFCGQDLVVGDTTVPTLAIDPQTYDEGRARTELAYASLFSPERPSTCATAPPLPVPRRTLWTIAAGNSAWDLDEEGVYDSPAEPLRLVATPVGSVLVVGAALDRLNKWQGSSYGSRGSVLYAPGVDWVVQQTGHSCTCARQTCRDTSGGLLAECSFEAADECPYSESDSLCVQSGTSFAAPAVAGAAALLLASNRRLRGEPAQLATAILESATVVENFALCQGNSFQGRLFNAGALLRENPL